jgi:peptidoglycan/LPS O-acetylase OafA/YrhL
VLREPTYDIFLELVQWLFFIQADINLVYGAKLFIAGVVWSLAFEWTFYFSLGIIGASFFRIKTSVATLIVTGLFLVLFFVILFQFYPVDTWKRMTPFLGGIVAAFLVRNQKVRRVGSSIWISPVLLFMLIYVLLNYPSIFDPVPFLCMTIIFIAIACGNDLFGVLTLKASCLLGQISYSVYLLHGLILFTTFRFIFGFDRVAQFSPQLHWVVIAGCSVIVVIICSTTYKYIEKPGIDRTTFILNKLKRLWDSDIALKV